MSQRDQETLSPFAISFKDENGRYPNWHPTFGQLCTTQKNQAARYVKTDERGTHLCVVAIINNDAIEVPATPHLPNHKPDYKVVDLKDLEILAEQGRFK
jgi:hypothetical protein